MYEYIRPTKKQYVETERDGDEDNMCIVFKNTQDEMTYAP